MMWKNYKGLIPEKPGELICDWCGKIIPHIFAGDEVDIHGKPYFVCIQCLKIVSELDAMKGRNKK